MAITAISPNSTASTTESAKTGSSVLGQDAFLKLLVTQLRYQDPLQPMEDQEFISQLATFSSLEQMTGLNTKFSSMSTYLQDSLYAITSIQQATACLGNEIDYKDGENVLTGKVDAVRIEEGLPMLMVGDTKVDLSSVIAIRKPASSTAESGDSAGE